MIKFGQKIKSSDDPEATRYFVTSDLHFGHKSILKFCPESRPWDTVEEMNEALIEEWNKIVRQQDTVFVLGDFSFLNKEKTLEILNQLNGTIIFVLGNHCKVLRNQLHQQYQMFDYLEIKYNSTHIVMCHYALRVWNRSHYGSCHIFGHSHNSLEGLGRSMDIGWDCHQRVMPLDEVVEILSKKDIHKEDGH